METEADCVSGEVVLLYAFDVANEIRLDAITAILGLQPAALVCVPDQKTGPKRLPFAKSVGVTIASESDRVLGRPITVEIHVYEVGVVCITARVRFAALALPDLLPFRQPVLEDGRSLDRFARELCNATCREIASSLVQPGEESEPEAYTAFVLSELAEGRDATRWLAEHRRDVAGLLSDTPADRLSDPRVEEALRLQRSFENTDLVVVDWDAALIVDLVGSAADILFVLELANLQLEEFRWMDRRLDEELDDAYAGLRKKGWRSFRSSLAAIRSLRQLSLDLARLADEVNHSSKFIGDWHLARVYLLARERFHIDQWRASVEQRLDQLDELYTLVRGELYDRRMLWLEIIIVLFFAVDILIILLKP